MNQSRQIILWLILLTSLAVALLLWENAANNSRNVAFFFASPSQVASALRRLVSTGLAAQDVAASGKATVYGLGLGLAFGSLVGTLALLVPRISKTIGGLVSVLSALPILAVAPMFLIWFGTGLALKVSIAAILSSLIFAHRVMGVRSRISEELREFLRANVQSWGMETRKVLFPLAVGEALADFPAAANAAFLGVFVGEFISADRGIGYRILRNGALYQVDIVLAETFLALCLLLALQIAVLAIRQWAVFLAQWVSLDPALRVRRSLFGWISFDPIAKKDAP